MLAFLSTYPDINAQLVLTDRVADFVEDRVDIALRIGDMPDSSLIATRLGSVRRVLCASPGYLATNAPASLQPRDLRHHACITFNGLMSPTAWTFRGGKTEMHVPVRSRLVVNTAEGAVDAAVAGLGITRVLSYQIAAALCGGTLKTVLESFEPEPSPVNLVYSGQGLLPLKTRNFIDFATDRLRSKLRGL